MLFEDVTAQLHALPTSNPDQAFIRRYLGTPREVLGVRADDLRKLAKEIAKANQEWDDARGWRCSTRSMPATSSSSAAWPGCCWACCTRCATGWICAHLRGWLAQQAGWAEVDTTCQSSWTDKEVLARWAEWDPFLDELSQAGNISLRRASLVLLVTPLRHNADPRLTQRALANVQRLQDERDRMITKAVSWVLRSMVAEQPETVRRYLDANAGELQATVVREVRKKLETGRKGG